MITSKCVYVLSKKKYIDKIKERRATLMITDSESMSGIVSHLLPK